MKDQEQKCTVYVGTREVLMTFHPISRAGEGEAARLSIPQIGGGGWEQSYSRPVQAREELFDWLFHQNFKAVQADQKLTDEELCHGHSVGKRTPG